MMMRRPSEQRAKSWAAGLYNSGNASWTMRMIFAPKASASERMAFSSGEIKGDTSIVPFSAEKSHSSLFLCFSSSESFRLILTASLSGFRKRNGLPYASYSLSLIFNLRMRLKKSGYC